MNPYKIPLAAIPLAALSCATVGYHAPALPEAAARHQIIAVLPFEMVLAGKRPNGLTDLGVAEIEEQESLAFQASLYDALLARSGPGRIEIAIQPIHETNRILAEEGIPIRDVWHMAPEELSPLLGVDAVVHTRVTTTRYLSDLASAGIEIGTAVIAEVTDNPLVWAVPWGMTKTHDVHAECSLFDGWSGDLLWRVVEHRETDWRASAPEIIEGVNQFLATHFPYRS